MQILLCTIMVLFAATSNLNGQTVYWDGGASTNNWTDANNWNPNGVPGAGNDVRIEVAATINLSGVSPTIQRLALDHASANLTIASGVTLTVDGTNFDGIRVTDGTITNNGIIIVQNIGNGSNDNGLDIRTTFHNNGDITVNGTTDDGVVVYGGAIFNNNDGSTLTINNAGDFGLYIDTGGTPSTFNNDGTVTVNSSPDDAIRLETGTLNNNALGVLDVNTPADLGISILELGDLNNAGSIDVSGAATRYGIELYYDGSQTATLDNLNGGTINITSSTLDGLYIGASTTANNDGTITVNSSGAGDITLESGAVFTNTSNAVFAPGTSPGTLNIIGDLDLGSATYNCEINGVTAGTYDVMAIGGNATLTNAKLVVDWGSFTPLIGQSYTVATFGSRTDMFSSVTIPPVSGRMFTVSHNATEVVISVSMILPVELVRFDANPKGEKIELTWQTASELNNLGFEIERSDDGIDWEVLGFVDGQGTINEFQPYTFIDERPMIGYNYYRLKQMDFDGKYEYSLTRVALTEAEDGQNLEVYPNPNDGKFRLTFHNPRRQKSNLRIYGSKGDLIWEKFFRAEDIEAFWANDFDLAYDEIYFVVAQIGKEVKTRKILIFNNR